MKELEKHNSERTEIHAVKPDKREKLIITLKPRPGQKVWELNRKTMIIREADFEDEKIELVPSANIITRQPNGLIEKVIRDILENENCIYCCATNAAVADKKFAKMLRIPYPKDKKPTVNG